MVVLDLFLILFCLGLVPDYAFERNRKAFVFNSLLTKPEVIAVLSKVREECERVVEIGLFQTTFIKPLHLEEFESAQSHKCTEVSNCHLHTD